MHDRHRPARPGRGSSTGDRSRRSRRRAARSCPPFRRCRESGSDIVVEAVLVAAERGVEDLAEIRDIADDRLQPRVDDHLLRGLSDGGRELRSAEQQHGLAAEARPGSRRCARGRCGPGSRDAPARNRALRPSRAAGWLCISTKVGMCSTAEMKSARSSILTSAKRGSPWKGAITTIAVAREQPRARRCSRWTEGCRLSPWRIPAPASAWSRPPQRRLRP